MKRARVWLPLFALVTMLSVGAAGASDFQEKGLNIVPFAGWTIFDNELQEPTGLNLPDDLYFGGRIGLRLLSPLWLELAGGYVPTTSNDRDATWTHLSGNLMLVSSQPRAIQPFLSLGGGISKFVPRWSPDETDGTFEAAAGLKVKISNSIGLRLEARNVLLVPKEEWQRSHIDNIIVGAGLVFAIGGGSSDKDGDGVLDKLDQCPDTPVPCKVDATGCPIDTDGDGVCDGVDQCADTPRGASVDTRGCPIDSDGDGVWNGLDQCPDTPRGCKVDERGCPIDTDGDGVCDGIDTCVNTARGCTVDVRGCSTDSDGDGVCDNLDKCPDTPSGVRVDTDGCKISEVRQRETELLETGLIRLHDVNFETAKSDILPESHASLNVVGEVLGKWSQLKIEVGGHCDSRGSDAYNLALSKRRVASVRAYLLKKFPKLEAAQLTARGYGESQPMVPNTSPENMAQNRRVEFKVLNTEDLKQLKP